MSCVKVSPDFQSLNIFWLAQDDENDSDIEQILRTMAGSVRHELSQLRLMGEVPRIYFVRDKHFSKAIEVDALLSKADFGADFVPTDPTLFMKATLELQMKLSDDIRARIYEAEEEAEDDDSVEEEFPVMRNDVMGIDHSYIMKKITVNMDKTKKAWEVFETRSETILAAVEPTRNFSSVQLAVEKLNREAEVRNEFVRFLERKQHARRETPERKNLKILLPNEDDEQVEEYRDFADGDYIEEYNENEDNEVKK